MNTALFNAFPYSSQQELLIPANLAGESVLGATGFSLVRLADKCGSPENIVGRYMDVLHSEGFDNRDIEVGPAICFARQAEVTETS